MDNWLTSSGIINRDKKKEAEELVEELEASIDEEIENDEDEDSA